MDSRIMASAALCAALVLAPSLPAAALAHVPNELTDHLLVEPLESADSVWDVLQIVNGFMGEVYPREGDGRTAIDGVAAFLAKLNPPPPEGQAEAQAQPRVLEMPISVDRYLSVLRKNTPGTGKIPLTPALADNPKAQLYTAFALPFLQMRGMAYRLRPLVAQSFVLHQSLVNKLRRVKQDLRFRSGSNGLAVFEFLTFPLAERKGERIQFERVSELQTWVTRDMIPTLDVAIELAEKALVAMAGRRESLDLSLFLQAANPFPDEGMEPASRWFEGAEVEAFVAQLYYNRARLRLFAAYDLDDLPELTNKLRNVYLKAFLKEKIPFSSLKKKPRIGSPPVVRYHIAEKFQRFLTLRDGAQGPLLLEDLRSAWRHFDHAMNTMFQSAEGEPGRLVNLTWLHASEKDYQNKAAPQIAAVLAGRAAVTDFIGGATVDIDLPGLLSNLPGDLKGFFPSEFLEERPYFEFTFSSGDATYTNYDFGTPVGWNLTSAGSTWARLFPNVPTQPNAQGHWEGPMTAVRDLGRTYVGRILAPIFSQVIY